MKAIIWAVPRTCSTTFLKSLSGVQNAKIFNELYTIAFLFGPERHDSAPEVPELLNLQQQSQSAEGCTFPNSICTREWIKTTLEKGYALWEIGLFLLFPWCDPVAGEGSGILVNLSIKFAKLLSLLILNYCG